MPDYIIPVLNPDGTFQSREVNEAIGTTVAAQIGDPGYQEQIRGPQGVEGPDGPRGLPGLDAMPQAEGMAEHISTPGPVQTALNAQIDGEVLPLRQEVEATAQQITPLREDVDATAATASGSRATLEEVLWVLSAKGDVWVQDEAPEPDAAYGWLGAEHDSQSVKTANGVEVARNPYPAPGLQVDADTTRQYGFVSWAGTGNTAATTREDAPWAKAGVSARREWTATPSPDTGDLGLYVRDLGRTLGWGQDITVHASLRAGQACTVGGATTFSSGGNITRPTQSRSSTVAVAAGDILHEWVTLRMNEATGAEARILWSLPDKAAGFWYELTDVYAYAGPHDPARAYMDGDGIDHRPKHLWVNGAGTLHHWDNATRTWIAAPSNLTATQDRSGLLLEWEAEA